MIIYRYINLQQNELTELKKDKKRSKIIENSKQL